MNKASSDSKVKKTLLRNYEVKVKPTRKSVKVVHDVIATSSNSASQKSLRSSQKENELSEPSLCSSGLLANYLSDLKKSPAPLSSEDLNIDRGELSSKMTKKLNFHFNDTIYKNLIELNANVENLQTKRGRRPSCIIKKKDLEPNIEDFYEDEQETDSPPSIPVFKPKYRAIKRVEDGQLHKLVAAFEDL